MQEKIAFGPVPSRRLGQSLGVNNIPPKICSYSCVYCQIGRTARMLIRSERFYDPDEIAAAVRLRVGELRKEGETLDYLTFVPDGEPTLDINIGREIELLKPLGVKIAVITNSSLMWDPDVREALLKADWISIKLDAASEGIWRRIDRPHGALKLEAIYEGIKAFSAEFEGTLATETMLVRGLNDGRDEIERIADLLATISPDVSYISIPTRPPAERWAEPPEEENINMAYQIFLKKGVKAEYLIGYEGNAFASTGDAREDLLSITAVHPMREDAVDELLKKTGAGWEIVDGLIEEEALMELEYEGRRFYMRRLFGIRRGM